MTVPFEDFVRTESARSSAPCTSSRATGTSPKRSCKMPSSRSGSDGTASARWTSIRPGTSSWIRDERVPKTCEAGRDGPSSERWSRTHPRTSFLRSMRARMSSERLPRSTGSKRSAIVLTGLLGYSSEEAGRMLGMSAGFCRPRLASTVSPSSGDRGGGVMDDRALLERLARQIPEPQDVMEGLLRRRQAKLRIGHPPSGFRGCPLAALGSCDHVAPADT